MPRRRNENQIVKETSCWQRRTLLEKILVALCILASIAILALSVSLYVLNLHSEHNYKVLARAEALRNARETENATEVVHAVYAESPPQPPVKYEEPKPMPKCETAGCVNAAANVMNYIDESIDPCENFYEFACGNYLKNTMIPEDKVTVDSFSNVRDLVQEQLRTIINEPPQPNESKPFKGIDDKVVKAYYNFMVDNAVIFGANRTRAEEEVRDALEFEIKLANISLPREERRNASALYNPYTIKQLKESYPYLDWLEYINALMPSGLQVYENETVINSVPSFFEKLGDVLNSTSKRTMANYFLWRVILTTSGTLTTELRKRKLEFYKAVYGLQGEEPRWKECIQFSSESLPISVSALYVRKYFTEESRRAAIELVDDIRDEFIKILHEITWMDEKTREEAIKKAKALTTHIGYPNELADNNKLEEYYRDLEIEPDNLLLNTLRLTVFQTDHLFNKLRKPVNKTDWETHSKPSVVNAYYSSIENSIQFPAAILQDRFFSVDRPRYMNYASIGSIIGHEITHGFDDQGRQFDLDGNLVDWWAQETQKQFLEKAQCIIEQYGNYTNLKANLSLNGINTQGENIADNGGAKEAYIAYNNWVERNSPEGILPGLKYNQQQPFWISLAQSRCSVARDEFNKNKITTSYHASNEFRIIGVVHNMPEFAYDFNCPEGTKMNPTKKCNVW